MFVAVFCFCQAASAFTDSEIQMLEHRAAGLRTPGERIAFFAGAFVGTPYDPDPLGAYVSRKAIVADDRVDCMYYVFRSTELALSNTPAEARNAALDLRFLHKGKLGPRGEVLNYEDRFQYGEDMLRSGKWGRDVTSSLGKMVKVKGSRGIKYVRVLPRGRVSAALAGLRNGDIIYFVKDPARRSAGEIIGHMGILEIEGDKVWLLHASGSKGRDGGAVKKVLFQGYTERMPFIGIMVGRL